jgi:hypothetical protein
VGIYGDADPLDVDQWSLISYAVPSDARGWSEKTSTCTGMYNGKRGSCAVQAHQE